MRKHSGSSKQKKKLIENLLRHDVHPDATFSYISWGEVEGDLSLKYKNQKKNWSDHLLKQLARFASNFKQDLRFPLAGIYENLNKV